MVTYIIQWIMLGTDLCGHFFLLHGIFSDWSSSELEDRTGRGISLPCKVYTGVLKRKALLTVTSNLQEDQCGFHHGCRTLDQLFNFTRILENLWEFLTSFHVDMERFYIHVPLRCLQLENIQEGWASDPLQLHCGPCWNGIRAPEIKLVSALVLNVCHKFRL